ncbi:hypothetical protein HDV01_002354 [Terramyces sp. JEL0728]|nr:hypothetical protein HDV01_002354 [Terramyces sp. JEL0728]
MLTYLGYPISQVYYYVFALGITFCAGVAGIAHTIQSKGFNLKRMTLLQYGCTVFGMLYSIICLFTLSLSNLGCAVNVVTALLWTFQDICTDFILTSIVVALILPSSRQKMYQYGWLGAFCIMNVLAHIATMSFTWVNFGDGTGICLTTQNPTVSVASTLVKIVYLIAMGISMAVNVFRPKSEVVKDVGKKGVVFSIVLIAVKLGLFIPYCLQVGGPIIATTFCVYEIMVQIVLVSLIIAMKPPGARTSQKTGNHTARSTADSKLNSGAKSTVDKS